LELPYLSVYHTLVRHAVLSTTTKERLEVFGGQESFPFSNVEKHKIQGKYTLQSTSATTVDMPIDVDRMENDLAKPYTHLSKGLQKAVGHSLAGHWATSSLLFCLRLNRWRSLLPVS